MKKYKRFVAFLLSALLVFSTISVNTMDVTAAVDMSSDEFSDDSLGLNSQEESWEDSESGFSDSYEEGASDELSCPDTSDNDNSAEIVSEKENIDTAADTEVREGSSDASEFEAEGSEEEFISDPVDTETLEESVNTVEGGLGEAPAETTAEAGTQEDPSNITQEENPNVTEDAAMEEASDTMQDGDPHTAESEADMPDEDMETPGVEDTGNSLAVEGDYLWPGEAEEYYDPESVSADRTAGAEQDIAELPLYTDYDTAVQAVRDQAAARKDRAYLKVSEDLLDQVQDGKLWDDVFAHTGNPKEGDYLLYSGAFFYQESAEIQEDGSWIVVLKFYSYYDSAEQEAAVDQEVERIVTSLGLRDGAKSKYDKVSAIYDYITSTVAYDFDTKDKGLDEHPEKYSAYGAIVEHNAVCQGYALMFYRLALEAGVDSRIISSNEGQLDDGGHAWNIACLDGLCYLIDTTWDAGKGRDDWVYFMRGKNDFGNHENPDDQFHDSVFAEIYPLSEFKYGFTIEPIATAPEISLLTWDDKVITTCAENGRAKLLLFYQEDCYWCKELFRQIREAGLQGVDIVLIDIWWQTGYEKYRDKQIKKLGTDSFPLDIPGLYYVFCSNTYNTYGIFEEVCGLSGGKPTPGVFMINANNEIIYGDYGANEGIVEMMSQYLSNPSAPAPGVLDLYQDGFEKIGRCGDDVIWRFYSDGTLRLSGKGYTWDNFWSPTGIGWMGENDDEWGDNYSPTYIYCNDVKKIIVDEEVGILGGNLFNGFGNVESITFLNHGPDLDAPSCDGGYKSVKKMYSSYCVMPYISDENRKVNVYYPESDPTWTPEVLKALGRYNSCRWIPVDENGVHHHEWGDWVITQAQLLKEGGTKRRDCTICGKRETASITEKDFIARKCGNEAVWRFYKSGILRIDGKGDLWGNFYSPSAIGWLNEGETREDTYSKTYIDSKNIKKVVVGRQIGRIGGSMFSNCVNLKQIRFLCKAPKLSASPAEEPQFKTVRDLYKGYPPFPYGKSITIQYPKDDTSWTAAMRSFLQSVDAGTIKWVPVDQNGKHTHSWNAWKTTKAATVKAVGTKARTCATCGDKQTAEIPRLKSIAKAAVSGVKAKVWTGKAQTQDITVKLGNKMLKKGTDYTVSYTANKNVGKATLAVTGKGSYQGTVKKTFAINPKGTDLTKINAGSRQFTVNWKKQTSQTTGYQIQYSTSSTFKTDNKTETISNRSTVSKTVAGLTKGKTYYVRIRTYKTVGNSRYYSAWSSALSKKITK